MRDNNSNNNDNNNFDPNDPSSDDLFYMGPVNDKFKNLWSDWTKMQKDNEANYMSFDDIMKMFGNLDEQNKQRRLNNRKKTRQNADMKISRTVIMPDDYQRLLEIRGYLNITEQYAYVKTLDKILNNLNPFIVERPGDNR